MTGIGMRRDPNEPRSPLRAMSAKQRKKKRIIKDILSEMLALQHEHFGTEFCELAKSGKFTGKCEGRLVVEHVDSWRDQVKTNPKKLQIGCWKHNQEKGSRKVDCRSYTMKVAYNKLAEEMGF